MRVTLLTTVAAAVLSLSVAAVAQTSGGASGGASGGSSGSVSGGTSGGTSGGASGGSTAVPPRSMNGGSSGGAAAGSSGSMGTGGSNTGSGSGAAANTSGQAGTSGKAAGTSGGTSTKSSATQDNAAHTTGSTSNVSVSSEQRTEISHAFSSVHVEPLNNVNFSVSVGSVVPTTVTTLHTCPGDVVRILHGLPECRYVVVHDKIVIVEPKTRKIVTVIERRG